MKHPVGRTRNNIDVYVDLINSPASKHIAQQPYLLRLVKEVLVKKSPRGPAVVIEHDMGRAIGLCQIIETTEKDTIFYAQGLQDTHFTRFIKGGKPASTQCITFVLEAHDKVYELRDVWVGHVTPPLPGTENEAADSKTYWANHAFVFDSQSLKVRSVTKTSPY